ncbi:PREDICTED: katanin p80 WD40 repeat-containing subunit B1 isoform X1 [Acromyrmex echinatior]|uniref:Katanin p80 WD40 repeat-containing subunit B1 n=1 Tax=Acromyrmex echinatior TaxID=103372 RepID=F4W8K7_ACREC|nr:PREDICTED: katanin p80 WD40 repeat-containing subunit B1 isoform X1 [Acromyrmex echinatior]EGI69498.1 Katanin p80 WD40-containing subunit B1 [Acromyrmex echinatior]
MASSTRRSWKLQEFVAHTPNVNCLALGHKSGRVLVTGGDDKKVNLWAVGKQNCIMSLSGHTTPIECVRFGQTEDLVCAGSQTGALKIWDLEHAKLARTLTGHKSGIRCMDFHPYGELLASGSLDTAIKLWDIRRKGCIFTYKGHNRIVNSLKFSPDGQWIASAGEEGMVKLWDLKAGRQLREFSEHRGPATTVEFHPHEFLLASGSADRTVHFWDLESFQLVSSTEQSHSSAIRCLYFSQGGECLFAGSHDVLKVYGWEPGRTLDTIPTNWGKVQDIAIAQNQLIGASLHTANVALYICDLKKIAPLGGISAVSSPFSHGNSLRKSFSKERPIGLKKHTLDVRTIEEADKSGTDPEDEATYADIPSVTEYRDVFQPSRALSRTPPPETPEAFQEPHDIDPAQPQILQNLSTSMSNLSTIEREDMPSMPSPSSPPPPAPTLSLAKPVPVRVQPIKSSPPVQRNSIMPTSQIRTNLQANNGLNQRASKNFASIPPLRQNITPFPGKRMSTTEQTMSAPSHPLGPQRSNSTLTPRVAPMAAVIPVMDDGKLKNRVPSPDSPKHCLKRQSSRDGEQGYESDYPVQINNIRHSPSDPALNRPNTAQSRSTSLNRNFATSTVLSARNASTNTSSSTRKLLNKAQVPPNPKIDVLPQIPKSILSQIRKVTDKEELVPMSTDKPYGLDVENFLPHSYTSPAALDYPQSVLTEMSETEVLNSMMRSHDSMMAVLKSRHRSLQIIYSLWQNKDLKAAVDSAVAMNDLAVIVDLLSILTLKPTMWNLDLCNSLLGPISELFQSRYEMYITVACSALRLILRNFASVIKSNVEAPLHTIGVDVSREERYHKCLSCYEKLSAIRAILLKKQSTPGKLGASFRELAVLIRSLE